VIATLPCGAFANYFCRGIEAIPSIFIAVGKDVPDNNTKVFNVAMEMEQWNAVDLQNIS
jgi:hypothetical protein